MGKDSGLLKVFGVLILVAVVVAVASSVYLASQPQYIAPRAVDEIDDASSSGEINDATSSAYSKYDFNEDNKINLMDYSVFLTAMRKYLVEGVYQ